MQNMTESLWSHGCSISLFYATLWSRSPLGIQHATHLGHELHQMCDMEFVTNVKMAQFIESSVKIQGSFVLLNLMKSLKLFTHICWSLVWINALGFV